MIGILSAALIRKEFEYCFSLLYFVQGECQELNPFILNARDATADAKMMQVTFFIWEVAADAIKSPFPAESCLWHRAALHDPFIRIEKEVWGGRWIGQLVSIKSQVDPPHGQSKATLHCTGYPSKKFGIKCNFFLLCVATVQKDLSATIANAIVSEKGSSKTFKEAFWGWGSLSSLCTLGLLRGAEDKWSLLLCSSCFCKTKNLKISTVF